MLKKIWLGAITLIITLSAQAAQFEEGKHYTVISGQTKAVNPVVTEFFSFYCPHCYQFEGVIAQLKPQLPDEAKLQKVHVSFMGNSMAVPMAKSYATMVALGVEETMVPVMFEQIHVKRQAPKDEAALRQLFVDYGVDGAKFDAAYNSFAVNSMQKRFDKAFEQSQLSGVPAVMVNDKYIVKTEHITTYDEYNQLVNYLLTL
ncbi:thiol:disulfide interchange protein DsbA/DsbL [Vibrio sp. SM6]|uniref:Thiol:disulfide interchange protein n=1 Tax=Vibrio agarilyticus TaxID=2726741 RepID=A0A7X8TNS5_9VIBR|nr:thiol:disulfide interchange protein DsbA/DsbL [Vibrio agarilyticus]NLS12019.1 thiol:disulfide interchange protein DsbA/DsbL [Vibrio agarilyticus]